MNPNVINFLDGAKRLREQLDAAIASVQQFFDTTGSEPEVPAPLTQSPAPKAEREKDGAHGVTRPISQKKRGPYKKNKQDGAHGVTRPTSQKKEDGAHGVTRPTASAAASLDKPTTVGGAMKRLFVTRDKWTREELKAALLADADWAKAFEENPNYFAGNLGYWSQSGKLKRTGDMPNDSFTVADKTFFGA